MSGSDADTDTASGTSERSDTETAARVRRGLDYALLGGLVLLGAFAALQFYLAADRTINVWVTREYRPPFKMVFNLVVLLVVGIGLSRQVRRLTGDSDRANESDTDATTDGGAASPSADPSAPVDAGPTERSADADPERRS
jgi:hypothetical protein